MRLLATLLVCLLAACGGELLNGDDDDPPAPTADAAFSPSEDAGTPDAAPPSDAPPPGPGDRRIVAYFAAWAVYGRDYHVNEIPADLVTHINYAFANIGPEGDCVLGDPYADIDRFYPGDSWDTGALRGSFHQLQLLEEAHPHLTTLLSVGGWTWSGRFSDVALTDVSRQRFAQSCVDLALGYGFDGLDIDWEFPGGGGLEGNVSRPEDTQNFTLLLAALRAELDARAAADGRPYELTIAAPCGPALYANIELAGIHPYLDAINLMAYDFHGGWDAVTGLHAALYAVPGDSAVGFNGDAAVRAYLDAGVPAAKLVLGVPFYGRGWQGVGPTNDGLGQPHSGLPMGTWEAGVFDWHDLAANYLPSYPRHYSPDTVAPWLYSPTTGIFISYEDPESLAAKATYVLDSGLGGAMFWELSSDDVSSTLGRALHDGLIGP